MLCALLLSRRALLKETKRSEVMMVVVVTLFVPSCEKYGRKRKNSSIFNCFVNRSEESHISTFSVNLHA